MRRLLMMFALLAFAAGTTLSVGCGGDEGGDADKPGTEEKAGEEKKEGSDDKDKESASLDMSKIAMTKVSFNVDGMK